jgi:hypothetical protein
MIAGYEASIVVIGINRTPARSAARPARDCLFAALRTYAGHPISTLTRRPAEMPGTACTYRGISMLSTMPLLIGGCLEKPAEVNPALPGQMDARSR